MEDGLVNKLKIGAVIQARLGSTRLPDKVLMDFPLGSGNPILSSIIKGTKKSELINNIFIAAPIQDLKIKEFSNKHDVDFFGGSEKNVFSRFFEITKKNKLDIVIRLTGDNPFIDSKLLDQSISYHIKNKVDYSYTEGLPLGCNFEIITGKAIIKLNSLALDSNCKEHVTTEIKRNKNFTKQNIPFDFGNDIKNIRLTIDYPIDYAVANLVFDMLQGDFSIESLKAHFIKNKWVFNLNKNQVQKKQTTTLKEELEESIVALSSLELMKSADILRNKIDEL